jgi:Ca2+/Na+ antiporter
LRDGCPFFVRRGRSALSDPHDTGGRGPSKVGLYAEDAIILLTLVPLFVLTVFFRNTTWGQVGLGVVLVAVLVVFVRRLRRVHKAFTEPDEEDWQRGGKE